MRYLINFYDCRKVYEKRVLSTKESAIEIIYSELSKASYYRAVFLALLDVEKHFTE